MRPAGTRRHPGQIPLGTRRDSRIMREEFRGTLREGADPATPAPRRLPRSSPDNNRWDMVGDPPLTDPWPHVSISPTGTPRSAPPAVTRAAEPGCRLTVSRVRAYSGMLRGAP